MLRRTHTVCRKKTRGRGRHAAPSMSGLSVASVTCMLFQKMETEARRSSMNISCRK